MKPRFKCGCVLFITCLVITLGQTEQDFLFQSTCDNSCESNPCLNNSTCFTGLTCEPVCTCADGYTGARCENARDPQHMTETNEHGHVFNSNHELNVVMKMGDIYCENRGMFCDNGYCALMRDSTFMCACTENWTGPHCNITSSNDTLINSIQEVLDEIKPNVDRLLNDNKEALRLMNSSNKVVLNFSKGFFTGAPNNRTIAPTSAVPAFRPQPPAFISPVPAIRSPSPEFRSPSTPEVPHLDSNSNHSRYNICADTAAVGGGELCPTRKCVFGVCRQELVDNGSHKSLLFECVCVIGARGMFCEDKCCLNCGKNGRCNVIKDNVTDDVIGYGCDCKPRYTGDYCETFIPDPVSIVEREATWYLWVVGVCIAAFVLLVLAAILVPYFMWKHRVVIVMKIVYYFQSYEDNDEKQWDAFVSYKSHPTDENFVLHELYPKLEKELGFRLCLHFRDFVPGETIYNNIINAVEGSRRTLLILTPRYIESAFTRSEYQKAQEEMLKRKHRIIPIVLEDITDMNFSMDKNLKGIINSVTYLEWPGVDGDDSGKKLEKFWKRLQLSLPKKKVCEGGESCISGSSQSTYTEDSCKSSSKPLPSITVDFPCETSDKLLGSNIDKFREHTQNSKSHIADEDDEEIYDEIGALDETLSGPIKEPSPDEDTYDKAHDGDKPTYGVAPEIEAGYDYAVVPRDDQCIKFKDVESDARYIEFRTDGQNEHFMDIINPGYIEFEI